MKAALSGIRRRLTGESATVSIVYNVALAIGFVKKRMLF